jgi:hypothetical protein
VHHIAAAGLSGVLFGACGGGGEADFDSAVRTANENMETPDGKRYRKAVGNDLARVVFQSYKSGKCSPADGPLEVVVRISTDGSTEQVLVRGDDVAAECIRNELAESSYASPPAPSYWLRFEMSTAPNVGGYAVSPRKGE